MCCGFDNEGGDGECHEQHCSWPTAKDTRKTPVEQNGLRAPGDKGSWYTVGSVSVKGHLKGGILWSGLDSEDLGERLKGAGFTLDWMLPGRGGKFMMGTLITLSWHMGSRALPVLTARQGTLGCPCGLVDAHPLVGVRD